MVAGAALYSGGELGGAAPPGFARDPARAYGDCRSGDVLVHAENLDAMRRLAGAGFKGRFRCIYFDPPFNSGRRFDEYDDAVAPEAWRATIRERLSAARPLLAPDGAIFVEIDDTELGALQIAMDEIFGRDQRIATITVVRSAATGHKTINRGPVNVTEFVLAYARERALWRCQPVLRERTTYDAAYRTWLENPGDDPDHWRFTPLRAHVRAVLGLRAPRERIERYALEHSGHVVRFAQPRYEAVSCATRSLIDHSRRERHRVLRLARAGRKDILLRGGNRVLFLSDKVALREGRRVLVEPLTNVWDDLAFQGIAREGQARFVRNKKPERLVARILEMATEAGDWILDAYLGSGTGAAVAMKMRRRWVGIERGNAIDALCIPRLQRVVDGADGSGVTRAAGWAGGGGFDVWT